MSGEEAFAQAAAGVAHAPLEPDVAVGRLAVWEGQVHSWRAGGGPLLGADWAAGDAEALVREHGARWVEHGLMVAMGHRLLVVDEHGPLYFDSLPLVTALGSLPLATALDAALLLTDPAGVDDPRVLEALGDARRTLRAARAFCSGDHGLGHDLMVAARARGDWPPVYLQAGAG